MWFPLPAPPITFVMPITPNSSTSAPIFATAELPDPFALEAGGRVATAEQWKRRREEIKALLLEQEYGHLPPAPVDWKITRLISAKTEGGARRETLRLSYGAHDEVAFDLELLVPQNRPGPLTLILSGDGEATPIAAEVVARGYILARFNRNQIAPDEPSRTQGLYALYPNDDFGTLAAWAWGYSRAIDYLLTRPDVDAKRIAVTGHSRGGKAALLAGALDERIALTAANQSGTGGAAPFRGGGAGHESLENITNRFGYWFRPRLQTFAGRENQLPFDQHFLLALVAPRALWLGNALQDPYSNLESNRQTTLAAREVFEFLGAPDKLRSFSRPGGHDFGADDWRDLLDFADEQFSATLRAPEAPKAELPADVVPTFSWRAPRR